MDLLYQRLVPGFVYTSNKLPGKLTADTPAKAHKYYNERFAHMQDGVLILSGDLKEEEVKPLLQRYLGGFNTDKETVARKPVTMKPLTGTATSEIQGQPRGIYVLMDAEYALTSDHYYTSLVAARALQRTLVRYLAPYGYTVQIGTNFFAQPQERFQIELTCLPAALSGLPEQTLSQNAETVLPVLREALKASVDAKVDPVDLKAWKEYLQADVKRELSSPSGFVATLLDRYANNKDIASRHEESIGAINAARVQEYLRALVSGGRIEFVSE